MPNSQRQDTTNYDHIKALVRDMHMTRNVARPEQLANVRIVQTANNVHQMHSMASITPCQTISIAQKLLVRQLSTFGASHTVHFDENAVFIEEDDASDTNTSSLDLSQSLAAASHLCQKRGDHHHHHKGNATSDSNYAIPSVVITDSNEPLDLLSSTQRRFSQLYSGLRRLSTSHTVGMEN